MTPTQKDARRKLLGTRGEAVAAEYFEADGWEVLERNWSTSFGEIDLIVARDEERYGQSVRQIVFVEVKTRRRGKLPPQASVTYRKRKKLIKLGQRWRKIQGARDVSLRFDVIAVEYGRGGGAEITHIPNAFDSLGRL